MLRSLPGWIIVTVLQRSTISTKWTKLTAIVMSGIAYLREFCLKQRELLGNEVILSRYEASKRRLT